MNRRTRWPPRNKPHIYKKMSGRKEWVVRYYDTVAKRVYAYHSTSFLRILIYARELCK